MAHGSPARRASRAFVQRARHPAPARSAPGTSNARARGALCIALALAPLGCAHPGEDAATATAARPPTVAHRTLEVDGVRIFYREAGPADAPTLLLLHGFPSSSHQFRRLIDALGDELHVVAPDYPGFGYSDAPTSVTEGGDFRYTFDRLTDFVEGFCAQKGLTRFFVYMFDFGAPVGFRLAMRHPDWIAGIITQNGNAYEEGLSPAARQAIFAEGAEELAQRETLFTLEATRDQYLHGSANPERVPPDGWLLDYHMFQREGRKAVLRALMDDYRRNVEQYPRWQAWLRAHQPPMLIAWGANDPIFLAAGARAFLRDLPRAELHLLEGAHFALDEHGATIAQLIRVFIERVTSDPAASER